MAQIIFPPTPLPSNNAAPSVFLAGSIEMGEAEDWQADVTRALEDLDAVILNPRRPQWNSDWVQSIADPRFREQVEWELAGLELASVVAFYFAPSTKAPVTLLELGLCARSERAIVCCPEGYWRRGNVDIVCRRYGTPIVSHFPQFITALRERLTALVAQYQHPDRLIRISGDNNAQLHVHETK